MFKKAQCVVFKGLYWQDTHGKKNNSMCIFMKIKSVKVNAFVIVITAGVSKMQDKVGHQETGINIYIVCNMLSYH